MRRRLRAVAPSPLRIAAVSIGLLASVPLVFVIVESIAVGWDEAYRLLVRPRVGELLSNTVRLVVAGVAASTVIGVAAAWLVERTDLPGRSVWRAILVAPLAVPAFVNSFAWVSLTPGSRASAAPCSSRRCPTTRWCCCRSPRRCAGSTRRSRRPPGRSGSVRCARSCGWSCRSCGRRSPAVRCWWRCTCWPSSARCRCCASRPSPPRSTTSTARRSTAPPPTCWPASWSRCAAWCCCSNISPGGTPEWRGSAPASPAPPPHPPGMVAAPRLLACGVARRAGPRRARREPGLLAAQGLVDDVPGRSTALDQSRLDRTRRARRGRRGRPRPPGRLAGGAPARAAQHAHRAGDLRRPLAARDRGRPGAGDRGDPLAPALYQTP